MKREDVDYIIRSKCAKLLRPLNGVDLFKDIPVFWIAGGAFQKTVNDVDLFTPGSWESVEKTWKTIPGVVMVSNTKNAFSIKVQDVVYQFCNYKKPTLMELLKAFDFAHCQIGAEVYTNSSSPRVVDIQWTEDYLLAMAASTSWYTGSEYPLSSLVRASKYHKSGILSKSAHTAAVMKILTDVVRRGFINYEDFKDQLDAIDLGMVPQELDEVSRCELVDLFKLLDKSHKIG